MFLVLEGFYFQRTSDQDFLRDLDVWMEAGLERNPSAYFAVDLFVASTMTFRSALSNAIPGEDAQKKNWEP